MRRALDPIALALLPILLLSAVVDAGGATLYVNRVIVADPGEIRLSDLVKASGEVPLEAQEILARDASPLSDHLLYIPVSLYRGLLEEGFGRDSIIVGSRSLVIPRDSASDGMVALFDRMVDFFVQRGLMGEDKIELEIVQKQVTGNLPLGGTPVFQILKAVQGSTEISFTTTGPGGETAFGRLVVTLRAGASADREGVRASDQVQVFFRKGPIAIEMQGKALSTAALGEKVSVYVADSLKSFSGRVAGRKAVEVEIP